MLISLAHDISITAGSVSLLLMDAGDGLTTGQTGADPEPAGSSRSGGKSVDRSRLVVGDFWTFSLSFSNDSD
jgi:hypothetical protein